MSESGFLSRWAQRKARARRESAEPGPAPANDAGVARPSATDPVQAERAEPQGRPIGSGLAGAPQAGADWQQAGLTRAATGAADGLPGAAGVAAHPEPGLPAGQAPAEALPSLDSITPADDFSPFMRAGVEASTRNAALRTLFSDPHFNVMDGLDIYIDDYSKPSPMPPGMLRSLRQSHVLGLFDDEPQDDPAPGDPQQAVPTQARLQLEEPVCSASPPADPAQDEHAGLPSSSPAVTETIPSCQADARIDRQTAGPCAPEPSTIADVDRWQAPTTAGG